jgi:succinate dehydrogenase / fumarate reductase cytochrome b subunit
MAFKGMFQNAYQDATLNKNVGNFSFWFHRLSGIGLVVYLLLHTYVLSSANSGKEAFSARMGTVQNPLFAFFEVILIAGVFFHLLNGARITVCDFFGVTKSHKLFFWIEMVLFVGVMVLTLILQWPKMQSGFYPSM